MLRNILLIGIGGASGSVARFLTTHYLTKIVGNSFPYGTFTANILGCFLIGIIWGLSQKFDWFTPELRLLLATGFCGGYTTFSSFAYENLQLLHTHQFTTFVLYTLFSFVLGILMVALGLFLISKF